LGRVVIPNTDDYWDTTPGYAVTKKRLVFPGTLSGLPDADAKAYILMAGLYTSDSSTASMWMTGQLAKGAILIKNGQGFAIETKGVVFVADVSVA
jgi:hypothetical protein